MKKRNSSVVRDIAKERILILFDQAKKRFLRDPLLSNRYVQLARKIAMKARMHMPREVKQLYCKHCHAFLSSPYNLRVRLQKVHVARTCLVCGRTMRFPYTREQKLRRKAFKVKAVSVVA